MMQAPIILIIAKQDGQQFQIAISPTQTVAHLKQKIQDKESIPTDRQLLTFCGQQLQSRQSLSDLEISNESKISLYEMVAKKPLSRLLLDECKKCGFQPNDPRVLSCGHSFCFSCISDQSHCPVCQSQLPPGNDPQINWVAISSILKSSDKPIETIQQEILCAACEEGKEKLATKWCNTCNSNFCSECDQFTHSQRVLKQHVRDPLQIIKKSIFHLPECEKHNKERELYCKEDDKLFCLLCLDEHKSHSIVNFVDHSKGVRNRLFESLGPYLREREGLVEKMKTLREKKVRNDEELKVLEASLVQKKKRNLLLEVEISEGEILEKKMEIGGLVLKKAIEEAHVNYLVNKECAGEMEMEIKDCTGVSKKTEEKKPIRANVEPFNPEMYPASYYGYDFPHGYPFQAVINIAPPCGARGGNPGVPQFTPSSVREGTGVQGATVSFQHLCAMDACKDKLIDMIRLMDYRNGAQSKISPHSHFQFPSDQQRSLLEEILYPLIAQSQPELAGKIIGMFFDAGWSTEGLFSLIHDKAQLDKKIEGAVLMIQQAEML